MRFTPGRPATPDATALLTRLGFEIQRGLFPAERYADLDRSPVGVVLETPATAGELAADDPRMAQIRLLTAARLAPPGTPPPAGLAEPWASMLGRAGASDAPWAVRTLAETMPAVNGLRLTASGPDGRADLTVSLDREEPR